MIIDASDSLSQATGQISTGPPTGFLENFGPSARLSMRADRSISEIDARTQTIGELHEAYRPVAEALGVPNPRNLDPETRLREWHSKILEAAKDQPELVEGLPTWESKWEERKAEVQALQGEATDVGSRSTALGVAGSIAGSMAAITTDPPILASMMFGAPLSAGILRGALIESGIAMGTEALIQPQVQSFREDLGLESGFMEGLTNVALAGGGAAAFSLAFRSGAVGVNKLLEKAREIKNPSAEVRAAIDHLQQIEEIQQASPFAENPRATREHQERYDAAVRSVYEGARLEMDHPVAAIRDQQSIVLARRLPELPEEFALRPDVVAVRGAIDDLRRGLHGSQTRSLRGRVPGVRIPEIADIYAHYADGELAFQMNAFLRGLSEAQLLKFQTDEGQFLNISRQEEQRLVLIAEKLDEDLRQRVLPMRRVYRGLSLPKIPEVGETIRDRGFLSTSQSESVALDFTDIATDMDGGHPVLYDIQLPEDAKGRVLPEILGVDSDWAFQKEVLLPRGAKLVVEGSVFDETIEATRIRMRLESETPSSPVRPAPEPSQRPQDASPAEARDTARAEEASARYEELEAREDELTEADMATLARMLEEDQNFIIYREDEDGNFKQQSLREAMDEIEGEERAFAEFQNCVKGVIENAAT